MKISLDNIYTFILLYKYHSLKEVRMDSRLVVDIDEDLKKEAQIKALQNNTTLKSIVTDALVSYLKEPEHTEGNDDIKIY